MRGRSVGGTISNRFRLSESQAIGPRGPVDAGLAWFSTSSLIAWLCASYTRKPWSVRTVAATTCLAPLRPASSLSWRCLLRSRSWGHTRVSLRLTIPLSCSSLQSTSGSSPNRAPRGGRALPGISFVLGSPSSSFAVVRRRKPGARSLRSSGLPASSSCTCSYARSGERFGQQGGQHLFLNSFVVGTRADLIIEIVPP